jgi:4-amino-4-deoxy-L-arabinose transferase-like glycosyltransferase
VIAGAAVLAWAAGAKNSATTDEPYHVLASWSHVVEGKADLNSDKPPLPKLFAGLALAPLRLRGTTLPPVARLGALPVETRRFLYENTRPSATILAAARAPQVVFLVALLWGAWAWGRELWGEAGGLLALVALASQPLLLGHAPLVHSDVAAAATTLLALWALFRWKKGWRHGWVVFGLLLGLALLAKFSGLALVPLGALLIAVGSRARERAPRLLRYAAACALAVLVVIAGYAPEMRKTTREEERATIDTIAGQWTGTGRTASRLQAVAEVSPALAHYGLGLLHVYETDRHGQGVNYFFGRTSREGSLLYFPVALLVKLTLPFLGLFALAAAFKGRRWTSTDLFLLLPAGLLLLAALGSRYNIGARHLLPIVPLLAIFTGQLAASLSRPARAGALVALALSPLLAFPHDIAHFSLLAGGKGASILEDSNLDWGQDWRRLAERAARERWAPLAYVYIGPAYPGADLPGSRDWVNDPEPPRRGFYAVSRYAEDVGPAALTDAGAPSNAELLTRLLEVLHTRGRVAARIDGSITVYELGGGS